MTGKEKTRVLVAKAGLDGHDRGALLVTRLLRDAGVEVIYTGLRRTAADIVASAIQEDVDVIGVSILSGTYMQYATKILDLMKEKGIEDKLLVFGGVIPDEDIPKLKEMGAAAVFTQSTSDEEMMNFFRNIPK